MNLVKNKEIHRDDRFKEIMRQQFGINGIPFITILTIIFLLFIVFLLCVATGLSFIYLNDTDVLKKKISKEPFIVV